MGKLEGEATGTDSQVANTSGSFFSVGKKISWGCVLPVLLGAYLLAFSIWSLRSRSGIETKAVASPSDHWIPIEASFRLHTSVVVINADLPQLQIDLQNEIGIPDTQIDIKSVVPLLLTNWTEVRFTVSPDPSNDSIEPAEINLLKDTFVELFMRHSANLSLSNDTFGKVSHFEVLHFPGGITVVPQQTGFPLSKVLVLFNFTLRNSLTHVTGNFGKFREQLANGIALKPNENLFVQLTNLDGSTLHSPLIVQTSILPVVGVLLPTTRLRQLAQEILASPKRNLGLNHSLFGRVKGIELSSYLSYTLGHLQAPSPSPSPSPTPLPTNNRRSYDKANRHHHAGHHHHHHHHHRRNALSDVSAPSPLTSSCPECYPLLAPLPSSPYPNQYLSPLNSEQSSAAPHFSPPLETHSHRYKMAQSPYLGTAPAEISTDFGSPKQDPEAFAPTFTSSAIIVRFYHWSAIIMSLLMCEVW